MSHLRGEFAVPTYSGNTRNLEYVKQDHGIAIWHARFVQSSTDDELNPRATSAVCDGQPDYFSVHGRDADTYHVSGSRWFFDGAECERRRKHVLPSLVHVVNVEDDDEGREHGAHDAQHEGHAAGHALRLPKTLIFPL